MPNNGLVVTQNGSVDFARYPTDALREIASKYTIHAVDPTLTVSKIRRQLLLRDGDSLKHLLRDLHEAAVRHGASDVVELTATE